MYKENWYDKYKKHLDEPKVRRRHDEMFRLFAGFYNPLNDNRNIVDLGCATQEYARYTNDYNEYFGIDLNYSDTYKNFILADYTKVNLTDICPFTPTAFISLFSVEIFMSAYEKYRFYEKIFRENSSIEVGMVAGIYYKGSEHISIYVEPDGFPLRQTIEHQMDYPSKVFAEFRTYIDAPSELFGEDVVEVWKMLRRKYNG